MRVSVTLLIAAMLFAAPAFGQQRISSEDFARKVAISDRMEIQSSQLALSRSPDSDTKPFAEKMVKDHQQTSAELQALVESGKLKVSLPTALDTEHQKKLDELNAKSGKDFDWPMTICSCKHTKRRWRFLSNTLGWAITRI